jgi:hypothetical protein
VRKWVGFGSGLLSHDPAASIAAATALASSHSHLPETLATEILIERAINNDRAAAKQFSAST